MKIITLLKSGGEYTTEHVELLRAQVLRYNPEAEFICIGDDDLEHGWHGWWSKMELFKIQGPVLFFDLDTIVTGDLKPLFDVIPEHDFMILRDVYRGKTNPGAMQSSVMAWRGDVSEIYYSFRNHSGLYMKTYHGDQNFIESCCRRKNISYFQDVIPNALQSFKADVRGRGVHPDCKAVFFHGKPRPWEQDQIKCN